MEVKIIKLTNKGRTGQYIYIKEKNYPARYYKFNGDPKEIESTTEYYIDKFIKEKTKGTLKQYYQQTKNKQTPEKYIKEIKAKGTINKNIGKGITTITIPNILTATQTQIRKAKQDLLKELVMNEKTLKNLTLEQNMKKIKYRLEHKIKIIGEEGQTIIEAKKFNETLDKIRRELQKKIKEGEGISDTEIYGFSKKLKDMGYMINQDAIGRGKITRVSVTTTFRKAR